MADCAHLENILYLLCFTDCHIFVRELPFPNIAELHHHLIILIVCPFLPLLENKADKRLTQRDIMVSCH